LGEVDGAREMIELAKARADASHDVFTLATMYSFRLILEALRGDAEGTLRDAETLADLSAMLGVPVFSVQPTMLRGWARAQRGDRKAGLKELRQGLADTVEQKALLAAQFYEGLLAELEAKGGSADSAVARIDEALAFAEQTDQRWTDAFLHRIRGDILLKAAPENPARAKEAYIAAIAVAREQSARSFGLQAALSLAKLYQSTGRLAEAHAVLAPALENFSPTPEMPEIVEAQVLLVAIEAGAHVRHE
jgi:predicted ATPase